MEIEHLIGLGVVVVFSLLAAWLVWTCMCKNTDGDDDDDIESHQDEDLKSVNSRTKVISSREIDGSHYHSNNEKDISKPVGDVAVNQLLIKPNKGSGIPSSYIQTGREKRFADPFGEWQRREKVLDDTEALSGIKSYRKSPVLPHRS